MNTMRHSKILLALFALLLILGGCKGESPTAPPPGSSNPPGGGGQNPPPTNTGLQVALTATNVTPLIDSTVLITATVTNNGQPVPVGTAVEFSTNLGTFDNTNATALIKTTNAAGVATIQLSSSTAGVARVGAIVNNVVRTIDITFQTRPTTPPPPNTTPTITSVTPALGRPAGGETIRIIGTNFRAPVRVLFNNGGNTPIEATVVAVTPTTIDVITPSVNIGAGQQLISDIIVLVEAGTAAEQRAEATDVFTYRNEQLTPVISTATPNSGPVTGGTTVTIFGEGFQAPVQVLFGAAEARVLTVDYSKILVEAPAGRDTSEDGSETVTGFVPITVRNINSNLADALEGGFRYVSALAITSAGPTEGGITGGTRVEIDGIGFVGPVAVSIGGVAAQPIFVSGTKIIAITSPVAITDCADAEGAITVTNIVNGDTATGPIFTYRVPRPTILSATPSNVGGTITVRVANATGNSRIRIGNSTLLITSTSGPDANGVTTFTGSVPTTIQLQTAACGPAGVTRPIPTAFDITYESTTTGCENEFRGGALVSPQDQPVLTLSPTAFSTFNAAITPATDTTPASVAPSQPQTVTLVNTGTQPLTVTSVTPGAGCARFEISNPTPPSTLGTCDQFAITAFYEGQTTPAVEQCTLTINTTAGNRTLTLSGNSR